MLKKDEVETPTSCLNKAQDDEPIFVLRANDELSPLIVEWWAIRYRRSKINQGLFDKRAQEKHKEALDLAYKMRQWKRAQNGV